MVFTLCRWIIPDIGFPLFIYAPDRTGNTRSEFSELLKSVRNGVLACSDGRRLPFVAEVNTVKTVVKVQIAATAAAFFRGEAPNPVQMEFLSFPQSVRGFTIGASGQVRKLAKARASAIFVLPRESVVCGKDGL